MKKNYNLKTNILFLLLLSICFLFAANSAQASSVSANGQLQVNGSQIVNKNGKPFVIKGVSTHGLSWYPQYVQKNHSSP